MMGGASSSQTNRNAADRKFLEETREDRNMVAYIRLLEETREERRADRNMAADIKLMEAWRERRKAWRETREERYKGPFNAMSEIERWEGPFNAMSERWEERLRERRAAADIKLLEGMEIERRAAKRVTREEMYKAIEESCEVIEESCEESCEEEHIDLKQYMVSGKTTVRHARGIVVGCAEAGKTTLLYRLMGKSPEEIKQIQSTRGLQIYEYVFSVKDGFLLATEEQFQSKQLIRVPMSALKRKEYVRGPVQGTAVKSTNVMENPIQAKKLQIDVKNILDERENETRVSMIDFAGQFAYYACHQIYMSSEAFYILVLDMTQRFEDVVSSEEFERKGSFFSTWTYSDYLRYWIHSIKSFGGPNAPVLLIATHAEGKTKEDIEYFFECFWGAVPEEEKSWLYESINENEFAIGQIEMNEALKNSLQSIKTSITNVASRKMDTKIDVPSSWAILEHHLKESKQPILSTDDIKRMISEIPEKYQLKTDREVLDFLIFYHAHGIILYFDEEGLRNHVILRMQWFSNAFSKIIADKSHIHKDCRRRYIKEWECFNETGDLKDALLEALWKEEPLFLKHKLELMSYMERLRMLVGMNDTETDMSWYVPCMNRKPFKKDIIKQDWKFSSILCFRFSSFAMFVYYRLIAYCMSFLGLRVACEKDGSPCLYHTAAVFEHQHHTVILGICDYDIQLQVVRITPIESEVSQRIGKAIESGLTDLTKTFAERKCFQRGFKCQNIICSEKDLSFIPASELFELKTKTVQCMCCPIGEKHEINVQNTRGFWEEKEPMLSQIYSRTKSSSQKLFNESTHAKTETKSPETGPMYPFSKPTFQRDLMTSQLKAEVSKSVGLIYIDGHPAGTGFRVGDKYIMTCLHVIQSVITVPLQCMSSIRISMQFERKRFLQSADPQMIFHFEPNLHYVHEGFDVAILELKKHHLSGVGFPPPLSTFSTFSTIQQFPFEAHLIGHPGGVQMKEDSEVYPRIIEPNNDVDLFIENLSQWSVGYFPDGVDYYRELRDPPKKILFHTTFNKGSSGSPGVIMRCERPSVVLIVRGGTPECFYEKKFPDLLMEAKKRVEYGYAMEDIHQEMRNSQTERIRKLASEIFKEWI